MSLIPEIRPVRELIDHVRSYRDSYILKFFYLTAARPCEVVTKIEPNEVHHTQAYGNDIKHGLSTFKDQKVFLITLRVAKKRRNKKTGKAGASYKMVALPVMPEFEPWCYDLMKYLTATGTFALDLTRKYVSSIIRDYLNPLEYEQSMKNPLRHFRLTHLMNHYNFEIGFQHKQNRLTSLYFHNTIQILIKVRLLTI